MEKKASCEEEKKATAIIYLPLFGYDNRVLMRWNEWRSEELCEKDEETDGNMMKGA